MYFQTYKTRLQRGFSSNMLSSFLPNCWTQWSRATAKHNELVAGAPGINTLPDPTANLLCVPSTNFLFSVQASMGALWGAKLFGGHILSISKQTEQDAYNCLSSRSHGLQGLPRVSVGDNTLGTFDKRDRKGVNGLWSSGFGQCMQILMYLVVGKGVQRSTSS